MFAIATNLMAFYAAALIFEHTGIIGGVSVFLVTAFVGTIACSRIEENLARLRASSSEARFVSRAGRPSTAASLP